MRTLPARVLRKTAEFPWRALRELHRSGRPWLDQCKPFENRGQSPVFRSQKNGLENRALTPVFDTLSSVGKHIARRGLEKALFVEQCVVHAMSHLLDRVQLGEQRRTVLPSGRPAPRHPAGRRRRGGR